MRDVGHLALLTIIGCAPIVLEPEPEPEPKSEPELTYYQDVAPILGRRCLSCHRAGAIGERLPLDTYERVVASAGAIMDAVRSERMPPSVVDVSGACGEFENPRRLLADELAILLRWGAAEDHPAGTPLAIDPPAIPHLERVDLMLEMPEPYAPVPDRADDYRCFVLEPNLARDAYVTAYEVVPGNTASVHHVLLFSLADETSDAEAIANEAEDAAPGYECFGGPRASNFRFLAGWAPGTGATRFPDGTGLLLPAGRRAVLQVHYNLEVSSAPDRTRVELTLADRIDEEAIVLPLADLELELEPRRSRVDTSIEVTLGENDRFSVLGAFPHMHRLGRELRVERNGDCMLDVPRWDFEWQEFFFYAQPIETMPNDRVKLTCTYDTMSRSDVVRWGEGTDDEMCLVGFYVVRR